MFVDNFTSSSDFYSLGGDSSSDEEAKRCVGRGVGAIVQAEFPADRQGIYLML